jgi:hypothetical protein
VTKIAEMGRLGVNVEGTPGESLPPAPAGYASTRPLVDPVADAFQ